MPLGKVWREVVYEALEAIGGSGSLDEIYRSVNKLFLEADESPPPTWTAIVRRELEYNSSNSESFKFRFDHFKSLRGIGKGFWGIRGFEKGPENKEETDLDDETRRRNTYISRIVRDGRLISELKKEYENRCQICSHQMIFPNGKTYSEVHHLKPLGKPHNGPDTKSNMIVVCPNCHVLLDYGAIHIRNSTIKISKHIMDDAFVSYSNSLVQWEIDAIE